jgi:hypothetical protein
VTSPASTGRSAIVGIVLVSLVVGITAITGTRYETNDDPLLNAIAAGRVIADEPDEHLVFTNVLVGLGLKRLYLAWPGAPWYGTCLLVLLGMSTLAFVWAFAQGPPGWRWGRACLIAAFLVATVSVAVAKLQFTRVAFLSSEAGWLVIAASALRAETAPRRCSWVLGAGLVLAGTLVRAEAAALATVLSIPALLTAAVLARGAGRGLPRRVAIVAVTVVALCGLSLAVDSRYYRADPAWREFLQYHWLRAEFIDAGRVTDAAVESAPAKAVGWTENDLWMMRNWFGLHPTVFSRQHLESVLAGSARAWRLVDPGAFADWLAADAARPAAGALLVLAGCAAWVAGWRAAGWPVAAALALVASAAGVLLANAHFPARMYEPAMSVPAATGLLLAARTRDAGPDSTGRRSIGVWILIALAAALGVATVRDAAAFTHERRVDYRALRRAVTRLDPSPEQLYVVWGGNLAYESLIAPLDDLRALDRFTILPLGWPNRSPIMSRRLSRFGIDDLHRAFWQGDRVFVITTDRRCRRLSAFIAQHYGQAVACESVDDVLSVKRLVRVERRGPAVNVRWQASVDEPARRRLEAFHGLANPRPLGDRTWRYEVTDPSASRLLALVAEPAAEDTSGIDRATGQLERPTVARSR